MYKESILHGRRGSVLRGISAIDIALWDIKGQYLKKPICHLLSESIKPKVRAYASGGSVAFSKAEIEADVDDILEKGYNAYKMKSYLVIFFIISYY